MTPNPEQRQWRYLGSLRRIVIAVAAILAVVLGGGLLLPGSWAIEREIVIAAPPPAVYAAVNPLRRWREWAVRFDLGPEAAVEYSGPEAGPGATVRWQDAGGRGVLKIMDNVRDRKVEYQMLLDGGAVALSGAIRLQPEDAGTRVVWRTGLRVGGNPVARYAALWTRRQLENEIDASLARLKARMETKR